MDWLLHIDIDELFLVSSPNSWEQPPSVGHHFASIPSSVDYVAYVNHEAVPEHTRNVTNYFTEISLFKQNPNVFKRQAQEVCTCHTLSILGDARLTAGFVGRRQCLEIHPWLDWLGNSGQSVQKLRFSLTQSPHPSICQRRELCLVCFG